jgi:hypothetical protein
MRSIVLALAAVVGLSRPIQAPPAPAPRDHYTGLTDEELLATVLDRLNRHCHPTVALGDKQVPLPMGVVVADTEGEMPGRMAFTRRSGPGFLIVLDDDLHGMTLVETLEHEWAHTLAWDDSGKDAHGDAWGVAWARAYRAGNLDQD